MLTPDRYKEIGAVVKSWQTKRECKYDAASAVLDMLVDLAAEVDRLRTPSQGPQGSGHLKPVILDAKGQPVVPPPLAHQFAAERRQQYDDDRFDAIMHPEDPNRWRVFSLRWGLAPPPGGWENTDAISNVVHSVRLGVKRVPYVDKHFSAVTLLSRGIALPQGITLRNGVLSGVESDQ